MEEAGHRVARRIRQLRLRAGLSLENLAERAGVPTRTLSRVERGETSPTVRTLGRIAEGLGVDSIAFFYTDEAPIVHRITSTPGSLDPIVWYLAVRPPEDIARALRILRAALDPDLS